ncbi:MAG: hypothetical protein Q8S33_37700 [Myxococcales bacterium]|nr:hypothetical protein [Myxococcales bacterium]
MKSASIGLALNDAALLGVASDEVGHAEFSWDLHHALHDGLSRDARNELATAGSALVEHMLLADKGLSEDVRVATGQPSASGVQRSTSSGADAASEQLSQLLPMTSALVKDVVTFIRPATFHPFRRREDAPEGRRLVRALISRALIIAR